MAKEFRQGEEASVLPQIQQTTLPTIADQVFDELQKRILTLELPPGTKLAELDVAKTMGVSRQPVREAFKRLSKLGFLVIRPQSSTTVSLISEESILRARFIRTALEVQTSRAACVTLDEKGHAELADILEEQKAAIVANDRNLFHALDESFHRQICALSGVGYVWDLIHDNKAHMDRVRMLSLNSSSQQHALDEHVAILDAIIKGDQDTAAQATVDHLSRILILIEEIKGVNHRWFTDSSSR
ncbi:MAG: GntR family transcriptional regulator [Granulosicoccus sp.]